MCNDGYIKDGCIHIRGDMPNLLDTMNNTDTANTQPAQRSMSNPTRRPARVVNLDKFRAQLDALNPETLKDMLLYVGSRLIGPSEFSAMIEHFASKEKETADAGEAENIGATTGASAGA